MKKLILFASILGLMGCVDKASSPGSIEISSNAVLTPNTGEITASGKHVWMAGYAYDADTMMPLSNALIEFSNSSDDSQDATPAIDCAPFTLNGRSTFGDLVDLRANVETGQGAFCTSIDQSPISFGFGPCLPCVLKGNIWHSASAYTDDSGRYQLEITTLGLPYFAIATKRGYQTTSVSIARNVGATSGGINSLLMKRR